MYRYPSIDPQFFTANRRKFCKMLEPGSVAIFNSNDEFPRSNDQNFPFRQNSDLFYLTGINQEKTILMIYPDCPNPDMRELLFIIKPSETLIIWEGHKLSNEEASSISGIKNIRPLEQFDGTLTEVLSFATRIYLNAIEYAKFTNEVPYRDLRFAGEIRKKFPNHEYRRAAPLIYSLRTIKSPVEISLIKKAIEVTEKAFRRVMDFVKPGVMEYQVQAWIEHEYLFNGANGSAYQTIVAAGKNACGLHYNTNNDICRDHDLLLMDFGAEYANYAADITRTIPVNGRFTKRQRSVYDTVLRVQKAAIKMFVPGNTIDNLNKEVNKLMEKEMMGLGLFTQEDVSKQDPSKPLYMKYFMHGTSHFLGLDVHDVGSKLEPFKPGMVFTCEPAIYIPEENLGIRLENNILVTENDPVDLAQDIPIEADEIEELMRR